MEPSLNQQMLKLWEMFCPYEFHKRKSYQDKKGRFVHYTSAEAAKSIFENRKVWMREASTMNDFSEMEYGLRCITSAYDSPIGERFRSLLDLAAPGLSTTLTERLRGWIPTFKYNTYLMCISEHDNDEDITGRLSMWRAYGGATSVALVLNQEVFYSESNALAAYSSPVLYAREDDFGLKFAEIVENLEREIEFVKTFDSETLLSVAFTMLRFAMLCSKHPGFHEEKEWRVIYSPLLEKSDLIMPSIQVIRGVPQIVQQIPLENKPELNLRDIGPSELINRVIIGPTEYPRAIRDAFITLMENAGIDDAADKVFVSDIPIRT